jgi:hypothetical protein
LAREAPCCNVSRKTISRTGGAPWFDRDRATAKIDATGGRSRIWQNISDKFEDLGREILVQVRGPGGKLILIAGIVLASATAQAGESRSLSPAARDAPPAAAPAPAAETPKFAERPAPVETKSEPFKAERPKAAPSNVEPAKSLAEKTASGSKAEMPRHKRYWTQSRIIGELHRHGISW